MLHKIIRYLCGLKLLKLRIKKLLQEKRAEAQIPDNILADLARCFARDIPAFFGAPANQEAYIKWLQARQQQAQEQSEKMTQQLEKTNDGGAVY